MSNRKVEKIEISSLAIKKTLRKFSPEDAICQYIWNGFDAGATQINVNFSNNSETIDSLSTFSIEDNGSGINYEELPKKFKPFYESEKAEIGKAQDSTLQGKDGYGRLTFFKFCDNVQWDTVYPKEDTFYLYSINIESQSLDSFEKTEPTILSSSLTSGTKVIFKNYSKNFHLGFIEKKLLPYILNEFAWYLEINKHKGYKIVINGKEIDYSVIIAETKPFSVNIKDKDDQPIKFECHFIQWKNKLNDEFSRFYLINENYSLKHQRTTKLNKKGDKFYHSVVVRSSFFDNFISPEVKKERTETEEPSRLKLFQVRNDYTVFNELLETLNEFLRKKRRPFLKIYADVVIDQFERENVFPTFGNNTWDQLKKEELVVLVKELYEVEPALFTKLNIEQKKTFVRLLNLIIDNDEREDLFKIIDEVVSLESNEREELREVLTTTRLSAIVKTTKLIHDRILTVSQIRKLVFDHVLAANERDHLQKVIEQHYWLFGEQYNLVCAAEVKFEEALRRYLYLLKGDGKKQKISNPDKLKEMDIFLVRQDFQVNQINNVVVELKSPTSVKKLTQKEFLQVQTYMNTILSVDQFNAENYFWEFYLIGQDYDDSIANQLENSKNHGEFGLAFKVKNYKIYVKKWSEIFNEVDLRLRWIHNKLNIQKDKLSGHNIEQSMGDLMDSLIYNDAAEPGQISAPLRRLSNS
jgi:hypothetical protein